MFVKFWEKHPKSYETVKAKGRGVNKAFQIKAGKRRGWRGE